MQKMNDFESKQAVNDAMLCHSSSTERFILETILEIIWFNYVFRNEFSFIILFNLLEADKLLTGLHATAQTSFTDDITSTPEIFKWSGKISRALHFWELQQFVECWLNGSFILGFVEMFENFDMFNRLLWSPCPIPFANWPLNHFSPHF